MRVSVFIAASLDGFIAREDGSIDWLSPEEVHPSDGDYGYQAFFASVDAIVMGRNTFDLVLTFGDWPYGETPVFVLSSGEVEIPAKLNATVTCISASPGEVLRQLSTKGYEHLYVDGGRTIQGFLREGLISDLIITRIPILLGSGIPLFGPVLPEQNFNHIETKAFSSGFVQSRYTKCDH